MTKYIETDTPEAINRYSETAKQREYYTVKEKNETEILLRNFHESEEMGTSYIQMWTSLFLSVTNASIFAWPWPTQHEHTGKIYHYKAH